jgi:hypothetical protein
MLALYLELALAGIARYRGSLAGLEIATILVPNRAVATQQPRSERFLKEFVRPRALGIVHWPSHQEKLVRNRFCSTVANDYLDDTARAGRQTTNVGRES